ncbi:MAG: helix-turn-helix transcriptional regulator, partial [Christensenellales bacterium]|nr:helix-turn-helix transcriptional regulator [Christensenellales bacterium]
NFMVTNRLKELRLDKDLKQQTLADELGIHQSTYSLYENGHINIPLEIIIKIADYYKVNLDYVACRTDIKTLLPASKVDKSYRYMKNR